MTCRLMCRAGDERAGRTPNINKKLLRYSQGLGIHRLDGNILKGD